ncbi:precorrin-6y C5,15-methyltransferase (decarboxylating) subunit CbiE [Caballeronia sp. SEWSISQ10-4 2]|uniref:precorrin-6y C5,15-methyltransferase (decarboxylating) subunit CbiE n=1 Tax=Caballeronia sp. SEWSISQ10-4 2 TaxID=2937438 RepID=UPI00264C4661|nr:precorrin-6y C5,15-methyltransferase (decarboxylating) subunit CbiE [Caballeronia sp. SEWSISQ10-4 2]MDN7180846.1 precorrin-6y C5,15-methyltransferase (decarboxylating) subunit CbiE [Caballeronia sp. SEWSISQ10-4 2]
MSPWLTVVGIGEDGWRGLSRHARQALLAADTIFGGARHLALLPARIGGERRAWPVPFTIAPVLEHRNERVCVLASGDPMMFGVGATFARELAAGEFCVVPAPSSLSLAATRLHWALQDVTVVSLVGRPVAALEMQLHPGARIFVLSSDASSPSRVAELLTKRGFGSSRLTVFEHLGGEQERRIDEIASAWQAIDVAALNLVAIECVAENHARRLPLTPGLPDDAYQHDGQLTKRDVRAITLSRLAPEPGELLWDVGAGCGSIGIEWMRSHTCCRAIAIEADIQRQRLIEHNRDALGVPGLQLIEGEAPGALTGLPQPDAIFIGGGVTAPDMLDTCWSHLRKGGRMIVNAVTIQSEATLVAWRALHGGEMTRISIAHAQPLGAFDTWRQALPITLLHAVKP